MNVDSQRERLFDLLADKTLVGLDPQEDNELTRLRSIFPDADALALEIELAAAAVAIAGAADQGLLQMPATAKAKLQDLAFDGMATTVSRMSDLIESASADAQRTNAMQPEPSPWVGSRPPPKMQQTLQMPHPFPSAVPPPYAQPQLPAPAPAVYPQRPQPGPLQGQANVVSLETARAQRASGGSRAVALTGWLAAAACLLLAVGAYYFRPRTQVVTVNAPPIPTVVAPTAPAPPILTPEQERESLLAHAGTAKLEWSKNAKDPASKQASGDVVWNAAEQKGYMRFHGLAKNDKRANVYQLWIFDKNRDDKYPVDGGVFTIDDETGDVVVPIKARLPVGEVALFAVTVEKPGGVVVSKRERIVVTAKPS